LDGGSAQQRHQAYHEFREALSCIRACWRTRYLVPASQQKITKDRSKPHPRSLYDGVFLALLVAFVAMSQVKGF
jgi:hypothetical protein